LARNLLNYTNGYLHEAAINYYLLHTLRIFSDTVYTNTTAGERMQRDIIVIGTSAGGVTALKEVVKSLPKDLPATIFIVMHVPPYPPSRLPEIISDLGSLQAVHPRDGERIETGRMYIAPPDHHLIIEDGHVAVRKGPKENRFRPSIDALFRSAAYTYGSRVIGVVLTGMLDDGTSGLWTIKRLGGLAVIEDPNEAAFPSMPSSVLDYVEVDHIVPISAMGTLLTGLVEESIETSPTLPHKEKSLLELEIGIAKGDKILGMEVIDMGSLTPLVCPSCSGPLIRFEEDKIIRFRCHTGHAYTVHTLLASITRNNEELLWKTLHGFKESALLLRYIGNHFEDSGQPDTATVYFRKIEEIEEQAYTIKTLLMQHETLSTATGKPRDT
jgi:two-component system chemotaxis response regulator CheB